MTPAQAKQLGKLIAKARMAKGLSYRVLGQQIGVAFGWLAELEQGHYPNPAPDALARLSEALDIEPARIDRITGLSGRLPEPRVYFRAKYNLPPEGVAKLERYIERLRRAA
jgi:transcriptional regulator with XRE-family HTH domain